MRTLFRSIFFALFFAEVLVLANGLLLVRLANSLSSPVDKSNENSIPEQERSITAKICLPTVGERLSFERNAKRPALPIVAKWEFHAWVNTERVTKHPIMIYDHANDVSLPPTIEHDQFTLTVDPVVLSTTNGNLPESLPSELSTMIGIQWTEKASSRVAARVLCRLELHPDFLQKISTNKYNVSVAELWSSIADNRPKDDWSRWETPLPSDGEPYVQVTLQPEAMRKYSLCLLPQIQIHEWCPCGSTEDVAASVEHRQTRIACRLDDTGKKVDCTCLYLEYLIHLRTPKKQRDLPKLDVLMWPAKEEDWPAP
ncbi:MAG: hypothetical protein ACK5OC_13885 [Pirellula sp.]|jgi:hypothetical protein